MPLWRLHYHLIWATKNRNPLITETEEQAVRWSVQQTANRMELILHAVGVMPDHLHVAVSIPPRHAVATAVRYLKGASARAVNLKVGDDATFGWQAEYAAMSFSDHGLPKVIDYVAHQRERHASGDLYPAMEQIDETTSNSPRPPEAEGSGSER